MTSPEVPAAPRHERVERFSPAGSLLLDGLRAGASQAVVVGHAVSFLGLWAWLEPPRTPWMQDAAVVVFFVLSGLLITHSVRMRSADPDRPYRPSDFFIDRATRIYTAYLPALCAVVVADTVGRSLAPQIFGSYADTGGPMSFFVNLFMLQGFPSLHRVAEVLGIDPLVTQAYGTARPFWTVAVEWWIYLAVGWVLIARTQAARGGRVAPLVLAMLAPVVFAVPATHLLGGRGNGLFSAWLFGAAISWVWPLLTRSKVRRELLLVLGLVVVAGATVALFALAEEAYDLRFSAAFSAGLALVLAGLSATSPRRADAWWQRAVAYLASYSFSLYLLHYTVTLGLLALLPPSLPTLVVILVVSNLVAMAFAWATERHHLRVRAAVRRWWRDRCEGIVAGAP